jgi:hypothetical protein
MAAVVNDPGRCILDNCYAPETQCNLGFILPSCEHFRVPKAATPESGEPQGQRPPWSGLALGLTDLFPIAALGRPQVIGVVGAAGAGKTTVLAAHWIAARRGLGQYSRSFAGSYSLAGWHQIARHLQWRPYGNGFPPHTSAADDRSPALLHIAYQATGELRRHILFTDAPGEWFTRWAEEPAQAPGAQWVADHSDAFVLLADGDALRGEARGDARARYKTLALQLQSAAAGRSVVPILTKADVGVPPGIRAAIDRVNTRLFGCEALQVSAHDTSTFSSIIKPIDRAVELAQSARYVDVNNDGDQWARQMAVRPKKVKP